MARPAGFSSDEEFSDEDDGGFSFGDSPERRRRNRDKPGGMGGADGKSVLLSKEEELVNAVIDGDVDKARVLIDEEGANPSYQPEAPNAWPPLLHAVSLVNIHMIKLLLDRGVDPNTQHELHTCLMALCSRGGAEDDAVGLEVLEELVSRGAKVDLLDWTRASALTYAVKSSRLSLALRLITLGAPINSQDTDGWAPLHYAADTANMDMVQLLKDSGAELGLLDRRGRSAYDIALMREHKEIAEMLSTKDDSLLQVDEFILMKTHASNLEFVLSELPRLSESRLHGYPSDVLKITSGIGLSHLVNLFIEKNVQLGELLTWSDDDWKKVGVEMSFNRKKLLYAARNFHERPWSKLSLGSSLTVDTLTLFNCAGYLSNVLRQLFVLTTTLLYVRSHLNASHPQLKLIGDHVGKGMNINFTILAELRRIHRLLGDIDAKQRVRPADLISPKRRKPVLRYTFVVITVSAAFLVFKLRPNVSFLRPIWKF